jgi:hypothetical protein
VEDPAGVCPFPIDLFIAHALRFEKGAAAIMLQNSAND